MAPQLTTMPDVLAGEESLPAIFVGSGGPSFTRGDLQHLVVQFAETLRKSGIKPGDTITIADLNTVSVDGVTTSGCLPVWEAPWIGYRNQGLHACKQLWAWGIQATVPTGIEGSKSMEPILKPSVSWD